MLETVATALNSASSRDMVLSVASYAARLISDCPAPLMPLTDDNKRLVAALGDKISEARSVTRLLDDLPMLHVSLSYGLGVTEVLLICSSWARPTSYSFSVPPVRVEN
jgi:hypothetical protein